MPINNIMLRKLLKILFLDDKARRAALLEDIRAEVAHENGGKVGGGGDFYALFWSDAKNYVFGGPDLNQITEKRIDENYRRKNFYPILCSGFLMWWNERRRWTNEPFRKGSSFKSNINFGDLSALVKVDNILSVRDGSDAEHIIYPYWFPDPELSDVSARLAIWLLSRALPSAPLEEIRILDVMRGRTYSVDRNPLIGNEEEDFLRRYEALLEERAVLKAEIG